MTDKKPFRPPFPIPQTGISSALAAAMIASADPVKFPLNRLVEADLIEKLNALIDEVKDERRPDYIGTQINRVEASTVFRRLEAAMPGAVLKLAAMNKEGKVARLPHSEKFRALQSGEARKDEMKKKQIDFIEEEALKWGFKKVQRDGVTNKPAHWTIQCDECERVVEHTWDARTSPEIMVRNMRNAHWDVTYKGKARCPTCINKRESVVNKPLQNAGPDLKIARKIYAALDDHFNDEKKLYFPGWDDQRIAKELAVSPELVIRIRKEAYGELAESPEISMLRDDVELLKMELKEQLDTIIADLTARVEAAREKYGKAIASVEARLATTLGKVKVT